MGNESRDPPSLTLIDVPRLGNRPPTSIMFSLHRWHILQGILIELSKIGCGSRRNQLPAAAYVEIAKFIDKLCRASIVAGGRRARPV